LITGSSFRELSESEFVCADSITPDRIEHKVEEIFDDGALNQKYNYIVYSFCSSGATMTARTYLDEIDSVSVFGPFLAEDTQEIVEAPALFNGVLLYLSRRFHFIEVLSTDGYRLIWQSRPSPDS